MSYNLLQAPCPHCPDALGRAQVTGIVDGFVTFGHLVLAESLFQPRVR